MSEFLDSEISDLKKPSKTKTKKEVKSLATASISDEAGELEVGTVILMGRPTKYKPEYCEMLIDHMKDGYSFESFAGVIRVNRATIYYWEGLFKEFSDAKSVARQMQLLHDEKLLKDLSIGTFGRSANAISHIYKMKCSHAGWIEKQVIEQTVKEIKINIDSDDATL